MDVARNSPCPCGSKKKFKRCCGVLRDRASRVRSERAAHGLVQQVATGAAADLDQSEAALERELAFLRARAAERALTHQDLSELTGHPPELIAVALSVGGPKPLNVLASIASAMDCRMEFRDIPELPVLARRLSAALAKHTSLPGVLTSNVTRGVTAHDLGMLSRLFGGARPQAREGSIEMLAGGFAQASALLSVGNEEAARQLLDHLLVAVEQDEFSEAALPVGYEFAAALGLPIPRQDSN